MAVRKRSAVTTAARDAVATTAEATVFLDPSGRRWRTLVLLSAPVVLLVVATLIFGGLQLHRAPALAATGIPVTVEDLQLDPGERLTVIGEGPMLRVLEVDRNRPGVGEDPFTGEDVTLTADEVAAAGDDRYVIQRYGYAAGATRTMSHSQ